MKAYEISAKVSVSSVVTARGRKLVGNGVERKCCCFFHEDRNPSMRVNDEKGVWCCDVCGIGGDVIDLVKRLDGADFETVCATLSGYQPEQKKEPAPPQDNKLAKGNANWQTVETYKYTDAAGNLRYCIDRQEANGKKKFAQWRQIDGKRVNGLGDVERVLYRLQRVLNDDDVIICEGEKCVHALEDMDFTATTNSGGSNGWQDAYADSLRGKHVTVMPDSDEPGAKWCKAVTKSLEGIVASSRVVRMPDGLNDIADLLDAKGKDDAVSWVMDQMDKTPRVKNGIIGLAVYSSEETTAHYIDFLNQNSDRCIDLGDWLPSFRQAMRPLMPGDLFTVLADTGVGKTAIAQNIAIAMRPHPVLMFQMELSLATMAERYTALAHKTPAWKVEKAIKSGKRPDSTRWDHVFICPESKLDVENIERIARRSELKIGRKPDLILIDYIGLIKGSGKRYERLSDIAEELKVLAKSLDCVIGISSQISRKKGDEGDPVTLHDAKDSGSIENSSQLVLGAWRPEQDSLALKILKRTSGSAGEIINCNFIGAQMEITERAPDYEQDPI